MKNTIMLFAVCSLLFAYAAGCGGTAVTTVPGAATKPAVEAVITPTGTAKPIPILKADEESTAQEAFINGDWIKAFDEYARLIKQEVKSPITEYYLYRLLQVADYGAGISGTNVSAVINHLVESPDANENLRALALWFQTNIYIKNGKLNEAATSAGKMGFVEDYLFIGPFENEEETGFNAVYDVEKELDFDKAYTGKQGQNQWFITAAYPVWGWVDMSALFRLDEDTLSYALTFINSPQKQDILLKLGSDGAVKVWLNDRLVISSDCYRGLYLDQNITPVRLRQGWNKVLIKVCQKAGPWRFMLRLTDTAGNAISNLNYANKPDQIKEILANNPPSSLKEQAGAITMTDVFSYFESRIKENEADAVSMRRLAFLYDTKKALDENDRKDRDLLKKTLELDSKDVLTHIAFTHAEPDRNKRLESYNQTAELAPGSPLVYYEFSRAYTTDPVFFKGLGLDWSEYFDESRGRDDDYEGGYDAGKRIRKAQKDTLSPKRMPFPLEAKEIEYLQKALELKPDFLKARIALAKVYESRGGGNSSSRNYGSRRGGSSDVWQKEANAIFTEILQVLPGNIELQKSIFNTKSHTIDERIEFNENLLKTDFTHNNARGQLINLYRQKGNYKKALDLCLEMLKINPYDYKAYKTVAAIHKSQDDWEKAASAIQSGLAIAPEDTSLLTQLADYYLFQNQIKPAIASLETALKIKPQLREVEKHLKYLKSHEKEKDFWDGYEEKIAAYLEKAKIAKQTDEKESARWILYNQIIRVKPNGTSSTYVQQVVKIFDDNGRNEYGYVSAFPRGLDYYPTTKSEVKQAKVYRKQSDSNEYMEIEGQYRENNSYASFPRLEIGDIIVFECQIDEVGEGRYRDYFGLMCSLQNREDPVEVSKLTLISPMNKPVYYEAVRCANPKPKKTEKPDANLIVHTWTEANILQIKQEPLMPADFELWPYIHFSTFKSWDEVAEWFWGLAKDQMETSSELKSAVQKAIEGQIDLQSKINAVYQLLVSSIRYEHVALESHYFKPFKASDTFARKYGDCKDTAILLIAMLKEAGIEANPVLIRAMPPEMGVVNTDLPSMKIFNHAIAHLFKEDGKDYFLDGTARYHGAEELPFMDQGAVAFVVSTTGKSKCLVTNFNPAINNLTETTYNIEIYPNRDAAWKELTVVNGLNAPLFRQGFQDGTKQKLIYEQMYNRYFKGSTVSSLEFSNLANYNQPVKVNAQLKIRDFARAEGEKMIFRPVPFPPQIYGTELTNLTTAQTRYYDMVLYYPEVNKSKFIYKIPQGYAILTIPKNIELENDFASCKYSFSKTDGSKIEVNVVLVLKAVRIPQGKYTEFREFCVKASKTAEQEVVLERKY